METLNAVIGILLVVWIAIEMLTFLFVPRDALGGGGTSA